MSFHLHADRLTNFAWFHMEYLAAKSEYLDYAERLADWLVHE